MRSTVGDTAATDPPDEAGLPSIPGYEFSRLLGRGGMGRVFLWLRKFDLVWMTHRPRESRKSSRRCSCWNTSATSCRPTGSNVENWRKTSEANG
jgi:hypothetical protein